MTKQVNKQLVFVHGNGPKPPALELLTLWQDALVAGMRRDFPKKADRLAEVPAEMIYFAPDQDDYDVALDLENRHQALESLSALKDSKDFRRRFYDSLPGKTAAREFVMDAGASLGLGGVLMRRKLPQLFEYLEGADWGVTARESLQDTLAAALEDNTDVLVLGHCMGSVIAYDALWHLNRTLGNNSRISAFVSFGSPLADNAVQNYLAGAKEKGAQRYPNNISNWYNISAEDDFVCHDKTVADDFRYMREQHMLNNIEDFTVYNLALRYGVSNPHSSVGYLIHPRVTRIVKDWLD